MAIIKNITMTKEEFSKLLFLLDNSLEDRESLTSTVKLLLLGGREFSGRNIKTGIKDGSDIDDFEQIKNNILSGQKNMTNIVEVEPDYSPVNILVVDAFIRCKIFDNPNNYNYVTT